MAILPGNLTNLWTFFKKADRLETMQNKHNGLLSKLNEQLSAQQATGTNDRSGIRQTVSEIVKTDSQLSAAIYEETSRRLYEQQLENEAAWSTSLLQKELALAKHERLLENASLYKLVLAASKVSLANKPVEDSNASTSNKQQPYMSSIDDDLKDSVKFGIAAAAIARRRKALTLKQQAQTTVLNYTVAKQKQRQHNKERINMSI